MDSPVELLSNLLESTAEQSGFGLAFMLITMVLVVAFVLRDRSGEFFLSAFYLVVIAVKQPFLYFANLLRETAGFVKRTQDEESSEMLLLDPVAKAIQVMTALFLLGNVGLMGTVVIYSFEPDEYWSEREERLEEEVESAEASVEEAIAEKDAFAAAIPAPDESGKDPRITAAEKAYAPVKAEHNEKKDAVTESTQKVARLKDSLDDRYDWSTVNNFLNEQSRFRSSDVKDYKRRIKSYCGCSDYAPYVNALRSQKLARNSLASFERDNAEAVGAMNSALESIADEQSRLERLKLAVTRQQDRLSELRSDLRDTSSKAGIQFKQGFTAAVFALFQFMAICWMVGLIQETASLAWSLVRRIRAGMDSVQGIERRLAVGGAPPPGGGPVSGGGNGVRSAPAPAPAPKPAPAPRPAPAPEPAAPPAPEVPAPVAPDAPKVPTTSVPPAPGVPSPASVRVEADVPAASVEGDGSSDWGEIAQDWDDDPTRIRRVDEV